jgi:hypothetical protein
MKSSLHSENRLRQRQDFFEAKMFKKILFNLFFGIVIMFFLIGFVSAVCDSNYLVNHTILYYNFSETGFNYTDKTMQVNLTIGNIPDRVTYLAPIAFGQNFTSANTDYLKSKPFEILEPYNFSVSFWLITRNMTSGQIVMESRGDISFGYGWQVSVYSDYIMLTVYLSATGTQQDVWTTRGILTNQLYHILITYNGDDNASIYINGTKNSTQTRDDLTAGIAWETGTNTSFHLSGQSYTNSVNNLFDGVIYDISYFDTPLFSECLYFMTNQTPYSIREYPFLSTTPLTVNIITPTNFTHSANKLNATYNATKNGSTYSCSIYINDILNQTNSSVFDSALSNFYINDMNEDATYTWFINCTLGTETVTSGVYTYYYHASAPEITTLLPAYDNTTVYSSHIINIIGNVTDLNLTQVNQTIILQNGTIIYNNLSNFSSGTTFFDLTQNIDTTAYPDGYYTYIIYAKDNVNNTHQHNILFQKWLLRLHDLSPANNTRNNKPLNVTYNATKNNSIYSCALYINGLLNMTNSSVLDNVISNFYIATMLNTTASYTWYVNCSFEAETAISGVYNYLFDDVQPFITWHSPNRLNTSIFDFNFTLNVDATDDYLFRVNATIFAPNSSVIYNNYSGDIMNTTNYSINQFFDTFLWVEGNYTVFIDTADSHTSKYFDEEIKSEEKEKDKEYLLDLKHDDVTFKLGNSLGIKFIKDFDRIKFEFDGKAKKEKKQFSIQPIEPLIKIQNSEYACHYVFGKYWFDCEGLENPIATLDKATNTLTIDFDMNTDKVITDSLGGLNENNETVIFQIDHCNPVWVCDTYNNCLINDTKTCNATIDVNLCGYTYNGNFSEFNAVECNYCSPNVTTTLSACFDNRTRLVVLQMHNFGICCLATNLSSDCIYTDPVLTTTFNFTNTDGNVSTTLDCRYSVADLSNIVIDGLGTGGVIIVTLIPIIILGGLGIYLYKHIKKHR